MTTHHAFAQTRHLNKVVEVTQKNATVENLLKEISQKGGFTFSYSNELPLKKIVTLKKTKQTVKAFLDEMFNGHHIKYIEQGDKILLVYQSKLNLINGMVRDAANGETIPYANVVLRETPWGDATDDNGYFVIPQIPDGSYTVRVMMMGYGIADRQITIGGGKTMTLDFQLSQSVIEGETIVKTAERERFERQIETSKIQMSQQEFEKAPAFVEADVFRAIQLLPGVVAQSDFSSALYIRGGNPSENMILLDDVRVYNPYHFGGVFSTFNTDAIKNVDVSLGGFPAQYGNAASSVISVTNKDGNSKEYETSGSVSLLSSKLLVEGPIPKGSVLISARRTYFDFIYNNFIRPHTSNTDFKIPYYFYDFHGKVNYAISRNSKITLSGFYGDDVFNYKEDRKIWDHNLQQERVSGKDMTDIRLGNFCSTLKYQYMFSPRLFSDFIIAKSRFRAKFDGDYDQETTRARDIINDLTIKNETTYFLSPQHDVKLGLEYQRLNFAIGARINDLELLDYKRKADFASGYIQDDWKVSPLINIQAGARFTYYNLGKYFRADPRLGFRYRMQSNLNIKLSTGVYHQYFYTFNPEDLDEMNYLRLIDLWFPVDHRYKPIRAIHSIAGLEYLFRDDEYMFTLEGYYKDYDNLLDLNELGGKGEDDDFLQGWGKAYGVEFLLRKQKGDLNGWLSYTWALTEKTIELARPSSFVENKNFQKQYQTYYPGYDRRHAFTGVLNYKLSSKWDVSTRVSFYSGLPETPTIGWVNYFEADEGHSIISSREPVKAEKSSRRMPAYFRWDVNFMRTYTFRHWSLQAFLQIINLTNHNNLYLYNYDFEGEYDLVNHRLPSIRQGMPMFPFVPTIGVNFKF